MHLSSSQAVTEVPKFENQLLGYFHQTYGYTINQSSNAPSAGILPSAGQELIVMILDLDL